ncbi:MAG: hypothetical protein V4622_03000 [Bacteroidota bacterium]
MKTKIIVIVTASLLVAAGITHHQKPKNCLLQSVFGKEVAK